MKTCSIEGCGRKHVARGLCDTHWTRWRRWGDARADLPVGQVYGSLVYHTEPMPCRLDQGDHLASANIPTATLATAKRWDDDAALTVEGWQPDDRHRAAWDAPDEPELVQYAERLHASWWAMDARIQAANDADGDTRLAAD